MEKIKLLFCGAAGRMGKSLIAEIRQQPDLELVGAVDSEKGIGEDAAELAGGPPSGIKIAADLKAELLKSKPQVLVDFTWGEAAFNNIKTAILAGCACVVGTTGIPESELAEIAKLADQSGVPVFIAPNFSIGANLMMEFARKAAHYFEAASIIEMHHPQKLDAPSGTALRTAELMQEVRKNFACYPAPQLKPSPARGMEKGGIHIHSVRLPGLLAHQEVILGGAGETLTLRHDCLERKAFLPGVLLAIRKVRQLKGMVIGLEKLL